MNKNIQNLRNFGFYYGTIIPDENENSSYSAFYKMCKKRLYSPGVSSCALVVRYYDYNQTEYLHSQYIYANIYDAMRQVYCFMAEEFNGEIELLLYTDSSDLQILRKWQYFRDENQDYHQWKKIKV